MYGQAFGVTQVQWPHSKCRQIVTLASGLKVRHLMHLAIVMFDPDTAYQTLAAACGCTGKH